MSAAGSSPCSETSQEASGSHGPTLKKSRWKTAFPSAPSPDSNSRGSDLQDHTETSESKELHMRNWRMACIMGVGEKCINIPLTLLMHT